MKYTQVVYHIFPSESLEAKKRKQIHTLIAPSAPIIIIFLSFARKVHTQQIRSWGLWQVFPGEGLLTPPVGRDKVSWSKFISLMAYKM